MAHPPAKRTLVSDQVFLGLCEQILGGRYAAGEKLPDRKSVV